jgi:hypothetical protein
MAFASPASTTLKNGSFASGSAQAAGIAKAVSARKSRKIRTAMASWIRSHGEDSRTEGPRNRLTRVNPPVLTSLPDGKLALAFQGIPGRTYVVQRSVNGLGNWLTLAAVGADASGKVSFTDESPPAGSAFYRLGLP